MRFHHFQWAVTASQGRGWRQPKGTGSKRKRPRRGWGIYDPALGRANALLMTARHGARDVVAQ